MQFSLFSNTQPNATSCNKSVDILQQICYNKPISGCIRMACDSFLTIGCCKLSGGLLQVDFQNLLSTGLRKLLQQVVTNLRKTSYKWDWKVCCNVLKSCCKSLKLATCKNSVAFLAVCKTNIYNSSSNFSSIWTSPIVFICLLYFISYRITYFPRVALG